MLVALTQRTFVRRIHTSARGKTGVPEAPATAAGRAAGHRGTVRWPSAPASIGVARHGLGTHLSPPAAAGLTWRGYRVGVAHCPQLALFPRDALAALLKDVDHLFTVEDHYPVGGLASLVWDAGPVPGVTAFGWPAQWTGRSGDDDALLAAHRLHPCGLADQITDVLAGLRLTEVK